MEDGKYKSDFDRVIGIMIQFPSDMNIIRVNLRNMNPILTWNLLPL